MARPDEPAQATCADQDGDGVAGLTGFVAPFHTTGQQREHVLLAMRSRIADIDESGTYQLEITTGSETLVLDAEAAIGPDGGTRRPG